MSQPCLQSSSRSSTSTSVCHLQDGILSLYKQSSWQHASDTQNSSLTILLLHVHKGFSDWALVCVLGWGLAGFAE